jgi:hypothetical protein
LPKKQFEDGSQFMNILNSFSLRQHVNYSTHESGNLLDLLLSRVDTDVVNHVNVVEGISDHKGILFNVHLNSLAQTMISPSTQTKKSRNFKGFNMDSFLLDISDTVVNPILESFANPQNIWEPLPHISSDEFLQRLEQLLSEALERAAPTVEIQVRNNKGIKWWNKQCRDERKALRKLEKELRKYPIEINKQIYNKKRKEYQEFLRSQKCSISVLKLKNVKVTQSYTGTS